MPGGAPPGCFFGHSRRNQYERDDRNEYCAEHSIPIGLVRDLVDFSELFTFLFFKHEETPKGLFVIGHSA